MECANTYPKFLSLAYSFTRNPLVKNKHQGRSFSSIYVQSKPEAPTIVLIEAMDGRSLVRIEYDSSQNTSNVFPLEPFTIDFDASVDNAFKNARPGGQALSDCDTETLRLGNTMYSVTIGASYEHILKAFDVIEGKFLDKKDNVSKVLSSLIPAMRLNRMNREILV